MSDQPIDGGPAFPVLERGAGGLELTCPGMTKRELFAAILMHSEAVTCGVPGEAADALVQAADLAGNDVVHHMAMNAVEGADALLRALAEPRPEPVPRHLTYNAWGAPTAEHEAIKRLAQRDDFNDLPAVIRDFVKVAMEEIKKSEDGIPF